MKFFGIQKTSTVDYPGKLCTTLFTKGCNMRCTYCYNVDLVYPRNWLPFYEESEILEYVLSRQDLIPAICITGGEPTVHTELPLFIAKLKSYGFYVKLDTNGTNPKMLLELFAKGLIDYVAMDIKTSMSEYMALTKLRPHFLQNILETIELLKTSGVEHEFRTTLVNGHHTDSVIVQIAELAKHAPNFYLQRAQQEKAPCKSVRTEADFTDSDMKRFLHVVQRIIPHAQLRI